MTTKHKLGPGGARLLALFTIGLRQQSLLRAGTLLILLAVARPAFAQTTPPGGGCTNCPPYIPPPPDNRPNLIKYMDHGFSVVNTNEVLGDGDTNFYNALAAMPNDTGTNPVLVASIYGNSILVKAMHFDYSAESRDFCLVISDNPGDPLYKSVDFVHTPSQTDSQNGWVIQGSVQNDDVTDPMFMQVSNTATDRAPCFFRAIPYSGPAIGLIGANSGDTVSNTLSLIAQVNDLSGSTNEQYTVDVDGIPALYTITPARGSYQAQIQIQTPYTPNGQHTVNVSAFASVRTYDTNNPPTDAHLLFSASSSIPLDFENTTFVAWQSDECSPDVGTNYLLFGMEQPGSITATISDPANGTVVANYSGSVPSATIVQLAWNFTLADGVTPYSNDTYLVTFNATTAAPLVFTNKISTNGVRTARGCLVSYEMENPAGTSTQAYLDDRANLWINNTLAPLYETLYYTDFASSTAYTVGQIGSGRDNPTGLFPLILDKGNQTNFGNALCQLLSIGLISDWDYVGHGTGNGIGGSEDGYISAWVDLQTIASKGVFAFGQTGGNRRMRKAAIWACYSYTPPRSNAGGAYASMPDALGIRPTAVQTNSWIRKNVGLFFAGELKQDGYTGSTVDGDGFEVACDFDLLWVAGGVASPGFADPTFSFDWAVRSILQVAPELAKAKPIEVGFPWVPDAGIYDDELNTNNTIHVRNN
jgi:hypothetical protein